MTRKEKIALLKTWLATYKQIDDFYTRFQKITGCVPESDLGQALLRPFVNYTEALSKLVNDQGAWLSWFIWENDCGAKAYEVNFGKKHFVVHDIKTLEKAIRLHRGGRGK